MPFLSRATMRMPTTEQSEVDAGPAADPAAEQPSKGGPRLSLWGLGTAASGLPAQRLSRPGLPLTRPLSSPAAVGCVRPAPCAGSGASWHVIAARRRTGASCRGRAAAWLEVSHGQQ